MGRARRRDPRSQLSLVGPAAEHAARDDRDARGGLADAHRHVAGIAALASRSPPCSSTVTTRTTGFPSTTGADLREPLARGARRDRRRAGRSRHGRSDADTRAAPLADRRARALRRLARLRARARARARPRHRKRRRAAARDRRGRRHRPAGRMALRRDRDVDLLRCAMLHAVATEPARPPEEGFDDASPRLVAVTALAALAAAMVLVSPASSAVHEPTPTSRCCGSSRPDRRVHVAGSGRRDAVHARPAQRRRVSARFQSARRARSSSTWWSSRRAGSSPACASRRGRRTR